MNEKLKNFLVILIICLVIKGILVFAILSGMDFISCFWILLISLIPIFIIFGGSNSSGETTKNKTISNVTSDTSYLESIYCYGSKPRVKTREDETPGYFAWRTRVLKRDGFTCVKCGSNKNLQVHHLWGYKENPELAIVDDNGVTLCKDCHDQYHNINGYFDINPRDFEDFIND